MKRVEIIGKIEEVRYEKIMNELEITKAQLEVNEMKQRGTGLDSPIDQLLTVARACYVDNDLTMVGSEPAIRSLWDEDEIAEIKKMIMQKTRKL